MVAFVRGRASFMRIKAFSIVYDMILEHRTLIASIYYQLNSSPLPLFSPPFLFSFFLSFLFSLSSFSVGLGLALRAIKNTPSQRYQISAEIWLCFCFIFHFDEIGQTNHSRPRLKNISIAHVHYDDSIIFATYSDWRTDVKTTTIPATIIIPTTRSVILDPEFLLTPFELWLRKGIGDRKSVV